MSGGKKNLRDEGQQIFESIEVLFAANDSKIDGYGQGQRTQIADQCGSSPGHRQVDARRMTGQIAEEGGGDFELIAHTIIFEYDRVVAPAHLNFGESGRALGADHAIDVHADGLQGLENAVPLAIVTDYSGVGARGSVDRNVGGDIHGISAHAFQRNRWQITIDAIVTDRDEHGGQYATRL